MDRPRARRALVASSLVGLGSLLAVSGAPVCPTALFLGIPCPGCGLTRATLALLHGDLAAALHFHPLVFVLVPLFVAAVSSSLLDYVRGSAVRSASSAFTRSPRQMAWLGGGLLALMLGVWGARFAGYFGGPARVESLMELKARLLAEQRRPSAPATGSR